MRRAKKTAWTRERLLDAVLHAKMTPEKAEAAAKRSGLPPLAPQPDPAAFDAMHEAFWTLQMALAWIAWRSHAEVIEVWDTYRLKCSYWCYRKRVLHPKTGDVHKGWFLEQGRPATVRRLIATEEYRREIGVLPSDAIGIRDAMSKLRAALSRNATQATGIKADTRERVLIPALHWQDLDFVIVRGRDVARFRDGGIDVARGYDGLAFRSQEIVEVWRANRGEERDASGAPGRPTSMHLVRAEYEARWRRGEVLESVVAEAEALSKWLAKEHPNKLQLTPKTIRNNISAEHRTRWESARK